jgi:type VI secretion system protein ImpI
MILRLEIFNDSGALAADSVVIREAGGIIGRAKSCACVLPDDYVSSQHARISHRNGSFLIEDLSRNGVCLNSPSNRLEKGEAYELKSGDLILIDPFEIRVEIENGAKAAAPEAVTSEVDPFKLLEIEPSKKPGAQPTLDDLRGGSAEKQYYRPPDPVPVSPQPTKEGPYIPPDWEDSGAGPVASPIPAPDPFGVKTPHKVPVPAVIEPQPSQSAPGELSQVLAGAGLPSNLVTPELARDFGQIIRTVVEGVMEVLRARQELKDQFRMEMTHFRTQRNNPLKFSANLEDALHNLLVKKNAAFLGPVDAFEDAFDDVLNHQVAMLEGMRAAVDFLLKSLSPEVLQEEFDKQAKGVISVPGKLRYWDQYRAKFGDMVAGTKAWESFSQEFARAYEDQLEHLKAQRRSKEPRR